MYGIVNKAIQGLITESHGEKIWDEIASELKLESKYFLSNESYPDSLTYDLIAKASEKTGISAADIMHSFGEYWVLNTGMKSYGSLMKAGGKDFGEFITNLPNFHSRVMLIYPKLNPPEFKVSEIQSNSIKLHYFSTREGLAHFVYGLIKGIAKIYETEVDVKMEEQNNKNEYKAQFNINW